MLRDAKRKVTLSSWVVKGMDGHVFGDALRDAAARGVELRLLVRGMNKRDDLRDQCYRLKKVTGNRLHIVGDYWNHSKAIVVDDREAMLMTANLDAQHGLDSGVEVGFWSSSPTFVSAVDRFLDRLFNEAAFVFDTDLPQATVAHRYGKQKEPRLAGPLRLRIDSRSSYKNDAQMRRWCQELEQQLVRVARHRHDGRDQILILTDSTAAYCARAKDFIRVLRIEDKPPREVASRFSSYLGESDITVEWD
jgi:phosphatidylserine/phosphatidylglycerophosphate/cardiolipin synthase-like enzyme